MPGAELRLFNFLLATVLMRLLIIIHNELPCALTLQTLSPGEQPVIGKLGPDPQLHLPKPRLSYSTLPP